MSALSMHARKNIGALDTMLSAAQRRQLAGDAANLRATYGPDWRRVPRGVGERASEARACLAAGLLPVDVKAADPTCVLREIRGFARTSLEMTARVRDYTSILSEVFATDLSSMTFGQLRELGRAVVRLADAPVPHPSWAHPAEARSARVLLLALGGDLSELSTVRRELYDEFSDDVWALPCAMRPQPVDRWWQSPRRQRVRLDLAHATRTGRPPADVKRAVRLLHRSDELKTSIDKVSHAVTRRLGHFADLGLPDIDGATSALSAMEQLCTALADRLDPAIVHDLAVADAFVCPELTKPAIELVLTITAWDLRATRLQAADALSYNAHELEHWVAEAQEALALLAVLRDASARLRSGHRTVDEVFEDAIMRDRVDELCADVRTSGVSEINVRVS
jgi:hypothetical protein